VGFWLGFVMEDVLVHINVGLWLEFTIYIYDILVGIFNEKCWYLGSVDVLHTSQIPVKEICLPYA